MKKRYPVYMLTAILLMVFTFSPLAYAETIDNSAAWDGRGVRNDRDEFGNFIGAVAVLATVASLVSDRDDYYYYRGRRYYRNGPWGYRNHYFYNHPGYYSNRVHRFDSNRRFDRYHRFNTNTRFHQAPRFHRNYYRTSRPRDIRNFH